ncbi:hypothetical protein H4R34_000859 [Dimargaris verticillata]|uniref:Late embryogenesis abundant protein LEA-2 subgroup domain-containing protein n=1 Tax=Dimargaris verticillata TaxID=2761393 RepID=A0A9W8BBU3_9FUNG|nr:hypothetical protein H4R34_000859 [Dimargaris verticillata]
MNPYVPDSRNDRFYQLEEPTPYSSSAHHAPMPGPDPFANPKGTNMPSPEAHHRNSLLDYYDASNEHSSYSPSAVDSRGPFTDRTHPSQQPLAGVADPLSPGLEKERSLTAYGDPLPPRRSRFRRYCCCCCRTRRSTIICAIVTVIILIGVAITLFFVWPRIPDVQVTGVTLSSTGTEGNGQLNRRQGILASVADASLPLYFQITAYNPNYIPWTVHNITVTGSLPLDSSSTFSLGQGALTSSVTFPKFANTSFELPFNLKLDPSESEFDEAAKQFVAKCIGSSSSPLKFNYQAEVDIQGIGWIYKPKIENSASFDCPTDAVSKLGLGL